MALKPGDLLQYRYHAVAEAANYFLVLNSPPYWDYPYRLFNLRLGKTVSLDQWMAGEYYILVGSL